MKELRFFYTPDIDTLQELPSEEAVHCVRVLRLKEGDEINLTDGKGHFYRAEITTTSTKKCLFRVLEKTTPQRLWTGQLHLALAPTKNMDRMEWLAEKATEIGLDELTFLNCRFSERKILKEERIEKILISAMKQSQKAEKPRLKGFIDFSDFVKKEFSGDKFIAHCYDETTIAADAITSVDMEKTKRSSKPFLGDVLTPARDALVLIGPEGDFSIEEVRLALDCGFRSVSLGKSRLRTETAALVAVHLMQIKHVEQL